MAKIKDNSKQMLKLIEKKLTVGIALAMENEASSLRKKVTALQVPPSAPGQYPAKDTGQLAENINHGAIKMEGRVGVMGPPDTPKPNLHGQKENIGGFALWWLELHPPGNVQPRAGMLQSWNEDLEQIKADVKTGALK